MKLTNVQQMRDDLIEAQTKLAQHQNWVDNTHDILDMLNIPRDPAGLERKLTPYGRLTLVQELCPELWEHIKNEMDKFNQKNKGQTVYK